MARDLGADVIKIGTASRGGGANTPEHPYYVCWNRNKRSINLNMSSDEAKALARRLAAECDVIIENFSAGVLRRWGLDRASMAESNPGLTVISLGGLGQTGPWNDFVTYAPTIHAVTGLTYLTNPPGRHDLGYGFSRPLPRPLQRRTPVPLRRRSPPGRRHLRGGHHPPRPLRRRLRRVDGDRRPDIDR